MRGRVVPQNYFFCLHLLARIVLHLCSGKRCPLFYFQLMTTLGALPVSPLPPKADSKCWVPARLGLVSGRGGVTGGQG